jgi:hypothetical protein
MYLAYGRLLFCVSDRCNKDLQGALLTACCVVIVCVERLRQQVMRHRPEGVTLLLLPMCPGTTGLAHSSETDSVWQGNAAAHPLLRPVQRLLFQIRILNLCQV